MTTTRTPRSRTFRRTVFLLGLFGLAFGLGAAVGVAETGPEDDEARTAHPVYPNAESTRPLEIGRSVPDVEVRSIDGESVHLARRMAGNGALLVFYRGGW